MAYKEPASREQLTRRQFLGSGLAATTGVALGGGLLAACAEEEATTSDDEATGALDVAAIEARLAAARRLPHASLQDAQGGQAGGAQ